MQTLFVRFGRSYKIPATVQIKHELRQIIRAGDAACAKPDVMARLSDETWTDGAAVGAASLPVT
jgi:hypothetical protein